MKTLYLFVISLLILVITILKINFSVLALIILIVLLAFIWYRIGFKQMLFFLSVGILLYVLPLIKINKDLITIKISNKNQYVSMFLLNDKTSNLYQVCNLLGITYLVAISGLHFNYIYNFLLKILNYFTNEIISNVIIFLFLFFYLAILNFSISALRAFLMLLFAFVNKQFLNKHFSSLDIFFLTLIILLFLFPNSISSYSFIYSFTLTFFIIILKYYTKLSFWKISMFSFLISIPISSSLNQSINVFTPIYSCILTFPYIIGIGISFLIIFFPFLENILNYYFLGLEKISSLISKTSFFISLPFDNILMILFYVLVIFFILSFETKYKKKILQRLFSILIVVSIIAIKPFLENPYQITFLNVYQGDCIIFSNKFSSYAYMIDCGGNKNIDIAKTIIYPFLRKKGITKIKTIVKTHDDYDHIGALSNLKELINIEEELDKVEKVCFFSFCFENINKKEYQNDNDNSIVLYGKYSGISLLLTGDISFKVENDILNDYPSLKVDVLKVAHHGSKYSSSFDFLNTYKPKISIISYGYNYYGHPHREVINRLEMINSHIFSTFEYGHITLSYKYHNIKMTFSKRKKVHFVVV